MTLHLGDCLDVMAAMEPESVDAIVTDPPYGLEFMGKTWDRLGDHGQVKHTGPSDHKATEPGAVYDRLRVSNYGSANRKCRTCGHWQWSGTPCKCENPDFPSRERRQGVLMQGWHQQWAEAAYRVAKPSAYLLAFGGTRTVHRMTVALEDAGWIIRDMLVWAYASGFPKSKASLKPAWEPIVMARKPGPLRMLAIDECRLPTETTLGRTNHTTSRYIDSANGLRDAHPRTFTADASDRSGGRWPANVILTDPIFDGGVEGVVGGGEDYSRFFTLPKADRADREPVLGGLPERRQADDGAIIEYVHPAPEGIGAWLREQREEAELTQGQVASCFPSRSGGLTGCVSNWELEHNRPTPDQWLRLKEIIDFDDRHDEAMTATRDVSLEERDARSESQNLELMRRVEGRGKTRQNHHPTVKPVDLMRHLVRLVTPTGGLILDPFLGSGTTAIAAEMEGFGWVGIEREAEYVAIAEARLNGTQRGLGLEAS